MYLQAEKLSQFQRHAMFDKIALFKYFIFRRLCSDVKGRRFASPVANRIQFEAILCITICFLLSQKLQ